jgi:hypothetical protein
MRRVVLTLLCVLAATATGLAHFVFVVPVPTGVAALVMLSENLEPDAKVDVNLIAGTQLSLRTAQGHETPLPLVKGQLAFGVALPDDMTGVVHGLTDLGVQQMGKAPPNLLLYHPKTILGDAFDTRHRLGDIVPVELVPIGAPGAVRLLLLGRGQPQASAEVTVIGPDGAERVLKTGADGRTDVLAQTGRYGAWARFWEATPGERGGVRYDEVRHYATLVFDAGAANASARKNEGPKATRLAAMPEPTSSFGAVVSDGWVYVYGGHVVRTHSYSTDAVSGRFSRLRLGGNGAWERLPDGPKLQGLNLVAHRGKVYRVGGMQPQNKPGEPQDIRSVADVARFDPATNRWEALPPLPMPRSSHDVALVGDKLIVVGGWTLRGKEATLWPEGMDVMDLSAPTPVWTRVAQPFKRRALTAAAHDGKVYVLGGFDDRSQVVRGVSIYDVASGQWTAGPDLPGGQMSGFGPAACVVGSRLLVSIDDGSLHRLGATGWDLVGRTTARIVHRCVAHGPQVLVLGGADAGVNSDLVEAVTVQR